MIEQHLAVLSNAKPYRVRAGRDLRFKSIVSDCCSRRKRAPGVRGNNDPIGPCRSRLRHKEAGAMIVTEQRKNGRRAAGQCDIAIFVPAVTAAAGERDRKSTVLNSSHYGEPRLHSR